VISKMKISALSTTLGKTISNPNYDAGYVVIIADALKEHRTCNEPLARAKKPVLNMASALNSRYIILLLPM
jgi:hypothetical protein